MKKNQKAVANITPSKPSLELEHRHAPDSLIEAFDRIQMLAEDSGLNEEFWQSCAPEFDYIHSRIGLSLMYGVITALREDRDFEPPRIHDDWGYIDTEGHFHPEEDVDITLTYL